MKIGFDRRTALSLAIGLLAPTSTAALPPMLDGPIEQMNPGSFFWVPELAPVGPVMIIVSLTTQRAYVYRNGVPIGISTVSTGKRGHKTPTGVFTILQKQVDHKSNLYNDAPMPFMQRLTWQGIAMHAGNLPGYPASHGCIRLPIAFARLLYGITSLGLTVVITNDALIPEISPQPYIAGQAKLPDTAREGSYVWQPEKSPSGPVSIVISGRDRRLVVLRNGVLIGSSPMRIEQPVTATVAYVLQSEDAAGAHWTKLVLPGQAPGNVEMTGSERVEGRLPKEFQTLLSTILVPGATILVTRESLRSGGTGKAITVITGGN